MFAKPPTGAAAEHGQRTQVGGAVAVGDSRAHRLAGAAGQGQRGGSQEGLQAHAQRRRERLAQRKDERLLARPRLQGRRLGLCVVGATSLALHLLVKQVPHHIADVGAAHRP